LLTVAFATEADVSSFKQPQGPGESVSEQLRGAIHQVLGVRVKFLARHEAAPGDAAPTRAAPKPPSPPVDENPLPPAPEWNVVSIPSNEPAAAPPDPDTEPEPPASVTPASAPPAPVRAPAPGRTAPAPVRTAPAPGRTAPQKNTADGKARYGEAVVREILGASFIEEQALNPTDPPAPLDSLDD
jgi:DNA polymerase-3 subunit gamma/tau